MSSGGAVPPTLGTNPFGPFSCLFPQPFGFHHQQQQQRFKIKRQRQRVDAGEPRNSYQGAKSGINGDMTGLFTSWMNGQQEGDFKDDQPTDLSCNREEKDEAVDSEDVDVNLDVENMDEKDDLKEEQPSNDSPVSNESAASTSSSSKRKQCQPQKTLAESLGFEISSQDTPEEIAVNSVRDSPEPEIRDDASFAAEKLSALQSQLSTPNLNDVIEAQRRFFEQQRKLMQPQMPMDLNKRNTPDFERLTQMLKTEITDKLASMIEDVVKSWTIEESRANAEAAARQQMPAPSLFGGFPQPNPLAFALPTSAPSGIFPPFNGFNPLAAINSLRRPFPSDDEGLKKKRAKVTDSVRKVNGTPQGRETPSSARSSPQLNNLATPLSYFPPTMVGHPLYGGATFGDREESPTNSDDNSDCGPYDGNQSSTLTPMHLRKAKLMFFYTRYPNSALLKSYFPDIRFNKNNTAQLVKWFSNFREFYYIQMEKYAKQALAEGVRSREEITVTVDSEVFKTLNQHYNRNNHIQPPERLLFVIQESLREFFDAIRLGKDAEPSWKKTIYKIINRLDDHIPEYFKEPNFLERLEC